MKLYLTPCSDGFGALWHMAKMVGLSVSVDTQSPEMKERRTLRKLLAVLVLFAAVARAARRPSTRRRMSADFAANNALRMVDWFEAVGPEDPCELPAGLIETIKIPTDNGGGKDGNDGSSATEKKARQIMRSLFTKRKQRRISVCDEVGGS